jgi:hypothetical protein
MRQAEPASILQSDVFLSSTPSSQLTDSKNSTTAKEITTVVIDH